ncbi:MAG TPA: ATP-dependent DNA helicase RecQ [Cyclobacteriaceae bacterium]|nr:ATP-dependent DNA helicase RecQ [Cyclobacteriaceae bacterium]
MKAKALNILKEFFGYSDFRPMQEDIVLSVAEGNDTLALLPTGGGKSICFQVPALMKDGICLVVSPLIALMKDQVIALRKKNILAAAVYSGMSKREIDTVLDNCIYGNYKFLYVSPERLKTELFIERFKKMNVSMIAVDEAHCISQWGYDFRKPYLDIAEIRVHHPQVPVIALTASATLTVKKDIIEKLLLKAPQIFVKSFSRPNLSYSVRFAENKTEIATHILKSVPGSSILYVRSRKGTKEVANILNTSGISAHFYHAGLDNKTKDMRQQDWMAGKTRVMVATNAFGMGIDKPDVRSVIHLDLPENLENYYQEAGRAGRDEHKAYTVLLVQENDIKTLLERAEIAYPPVEFIRRVYQSLANFFRVAVGSSLLSSYNFNLSEFLKNYQLELLPTYNALKVMQEEGFIELNESFYSPSTLHFLVESSKVYEFQIANAQLDPLIKVLLRMYGGELFSNYISIQEDKLALTLGLSEFEIIKDLEKLDQWGIIAYNKRKDKPQITFLTPRYDAGKLPLDTKRIAERSINSKEKAKSMVAYVKNSKLCRTNQLLFYFGEEGDHVCGTCDVCMAKKKERRKAELEKQLRNNIIKALDSGLAFSLDELLAALGKRKDSFSVGILREMEDEGVILTSSNGKIKMNTYG